MPYLEINQKNGQQPADAVIRCLEEDLIGILLDEASAPEEYFDLSSGLLGELLHKLSIYQLPLAIIVQQPQRYSTHFQSFLSEANQGSWIQSFPSREKAEQWLEIH